MSTTSYRELAPTWLRGLDCPALTDAIREWALRTDRFLSAFIADPIAGHDAAVDAGLAITDHQGGEPRDAGCVAISMPPPAIQPACVPVFAVVTMPGPGTTTGSVT